MENNTPEEDADAFFEYVDSKDQSGAVAWSLGVDRLNIYYNPYNIGSWALGIVTSAFLLKNIRMRKEEYKMGTSDYAVKIGIYADYSADIYNDGSFSDISVYPDGTDDYANSALRIQIQDENGQVTSRVFDDMYYFTMEAYYVKTGNRHFFV